MIYQIIVSFALGIVFQSVFNFGWSFALLFCLISFSLFLIFKNQEQPFKGLLLVLIFFAIGILRMDFANNSPDQNLLKLVGQKISFEAEIVDEPDVRDTSTRYTVSVSKNSLSEYSQKCTDIFLLKNSSCSPQSGSQGIFGNIDSKNFNSLVLLIADRFPGLHYGDEIKVSGKLNLPKNFTNGGNEFDYVSYLSKDKIHFLIYYPQIEKIGNGGNKIVSNLYSLKNIFIEKISAVVPEPNSSLLAGVIFGAKQSLGQELLDNFKKVGLIHIVVLSGYNITIIAAGIFYLTSHFGKRNLGFTISVVSIILFSIMVGLGATVIRAAIMAMIAILARFLGRPADALRWLFIAGFLMLLWNPLFLLSDPSFQLSFMATLGLIIFTPIVQEKLFDPTIMFLSKIKIFAGLSACLNRSGLREIISSTLAVQLFILPLLIKMSGQISLISFLVNPIVLPLVPFTMAAGALTGGIGIMPFFGQFLSWPFGVIAYVITQVIIYITEFSAKISGAVFQIQSLPLLIIFIWYLFYGFIFLKLKKV